MPIASHTHSHAWLRAGMSILALSALAACGGGGSDGDGPQHAITRFDVIPAAGIAVPVKAGGSLPLHMAAETYGPKLASMAWAVAPGAGTSKGIIELVGGDCSSAQLSARAVPGREGVYVATGECEASVRVPPDAAGAFVVSARVAAADGTQRSERIELNVVPRPYVPFDYTVRVDAPSAKEVALGKPVRLVANLVSQTALPPDAHVTYDWSLLASPSAPAGGPVAGTNEAVVVFNTPGTYSYLVTAKVASEGREQIKTGIVTLDLSKPDGSEIDLQTQAQTEQPNVFVGAPAKLTASFTVKPGTVVSNAVYRWRQLSGPSATLVPSEGKSVYAILNAPGTALFAVEVAVSSDGVRREVQTALVTVTAEALP